jgi:membrane-bound lytic murein transglycosylase D
MVAAVSSGVVSYRSSKPWHQSCILWSLILSYGQDYPTQTFGQEVLLPMARSLSLALLSLLLWTVSCTQSSFFLRPGDTYSPEEPSQITEPTTDPSDGAPADTASKEENVLAASPAQEERSANGESQTEVDSGEEPYSDQKRVDDALYYYQEALEYWNSGDPDRAIQSLDQSYQVICSIQNEDDPEITQQKEDLRLLISKRILEIYASRPHPQMGHSREMPLVMNQYVAREIKRFQTKERTFLHCGTNEGSWYP